MTGRIVSVNVSRGKHAGKEPVAEVELRPGRGAVGDAHAGAGDRQLSLLTVESIELQKQVFAEKTGEGKELSCPKAGERLVPGALAENLTTSGLELATLPLGTRLRVGRDVVLEVSKVGRKCHRYCATYEKLGDCAMKRESVLVRVLNGGTIRPNDEVRIEPRHDSANH